ncbi:hypothetical protein Anas_03927 [Armadillidium nasatum]|uniref:PML C-terminal domain-containing protein n=1 Tax=Armadillidium nasatum TaxID=96803 RepID=A0A5N5SRR7_9CRUS|nr:hypothetical protein Anas_03927 [Armadillidium nasatum]
MWLSQFRIWGYHSLGYGAYNTIRLKLESVMIVTSRVTKINKRSRNVYFVLPYILLQNVVTFKNLLNINYKLNYIALIILIKYCSNKFEDKMSSGSNEDSGNIVPNSKPFIMFNVQTSGFDSKKHEILQISALYDEEEFSVYTKPLNNVIDEFATKVNKLTLNGNNELCYDGNVVDSVPLSEGLRMFLSWLEDKVPSPRILMGHKIKSFGSRFIMEAFSKHQLKLESCRLIDGFVDTLPIFKEVCPKKEELRAKKKNYQLRTLALHYLKRPYSGLKDLRQMVEKSKIPEASILKRISQTRFIYRKKSFQNMIDKEKITKGMATKLAKNNIYFNDLIAHYRIGGEDTLKMFLKKRGKLEKRSTDFKNSKVLDLTDKYLLKWYKLRFESVSFLSETQLKSNKNGRVQLNVSNNILCYKRYTNKC